MSSVLSEPVRIEPVQPVRIETKSAPRSNEPIPRWLRLAGMGLALATVAPVVLAFVGFFLGILFLPLITLVALLFAFGEPSREAEHALHRGRPARPGRSGRVRPLQPKHVHV